MYYKNGVLKLKNENMTISCENAENAHDQLQIAVGERGLRCDQHDPSNAAHGNMLLPGVICYK